VSPTLPALGETLAGRYTLVHQLGEGGMSVVFSALDRQRGDRVVALKLLTPRYLGRPEREQRLLDEATYLEELAGVPAVVRLLDHGRLEDRDGWPFLVVELLPGRELNWVLLDHKFEPAAVQALALQIAQVVRACHEAGIVHRDLTPGNLSVVLEPLAVTLFDFSHAARIDAPRVPAGAQGRLTGIHDVPGTAGYMSAEQASSAPADPSMDVFAVGILLFNIITGRDPFPNLDHTQFIRMQREGTLETPRLQSWVYGLSEDWADIIQNCTDRDPRRRPSAAALVTALEQVDLRPPERPTRASGSLGEAPEQPEDHTARLDVQHLAVAVAAEATPEPKPEPKSDPKPKSKPDPKQVEPGDQTTRMDVRTLPGVRPKVPTPAAPRVDDRTARFAPVPPVAAPVARARGSAEASPGPQDHRTHQSPLGAWPARPSPPRVAAPAPKAQVGSPTPPGAPIQAPLQAAIQAPLQTPAQVPSQTQVPSQAGAQIPTAEASIQAPAIQPEPEPEPEQTPAFARLDAPAIVFVDPPAQPEIDDEDDPELPPGSDEGHTGRRVGILLALVGVLGVLAIGAWVLRAAIWPAPKDSEDTPLRVGAASSEADDADPDPDPASTTGASAGIEFVEAVPDLPPADLDPPEPEPEPKPKPRPKPKPKPKPNPDSSDTGSQPEPDPEPKPECEGVEADTKAAKRAHEWAEIIELTSDRSCWSSPLGRARYRVYALMQTERWSECVKAAKGHTGNPEIAKWSNLCSKYLSE